MWTQRRVMFWGFTEGFWRRSNLTWVLEDECKGSRWKVGDSILGSQTEWEKAHNVRWHEGDTPSPFLWLLPAWRKRPCLTLSTLSLFTSLPEKWILYFVLLFCSATPCGIWDLPWPGIKPVPPVLEARSLNHWTTTEVLEKWALIGEFWNRSEFWWVNLRTLECAWLTLFSSW